MRSTGTRANRLADTNSPYLLQHQHNPVDWHPWDEKALALAKEQDRPIFLSVGYATCHWCHVMEHESFADPQTAKLMNETFINIKVDREERPDIDRVYMAYVQAVSGSGGWPMSVWLTPDLEPFFGGTYFPPADRFGRPGFSSILRELGAAWQQERGRITETATNAMAALRGALERRKSDETIAPAELLVSAYVRFASAFDRRWGGFSGAPKFPRPATFDFLLRYFARNDEAQAAEMVLTTLEQMGRGGMYDHVGGGFHRYSVDASWHVPHFEKMLYDQAQLVRSYVEAFQISDDPAFAVKAKETMEYVLRDLLDADSGGFYSAEDADSLPHEGASQKKEGAFYVWTATELRELLGPDSAIFFDHFGIEEEGNADDPHGELEGTNVLHEQRTVTQTAARRGLSTDEVDQRLTRCLSTLAEVRAKRPRPLLDDKILCSWNGLMIGAAAYAGAALGEGHYIQAAERAASFVVDTLWRPEERTLLRSYRKGRASIEAYLEDYAFMVDGLLNLYEATCSVRWLELARTLHARQLELFWDDQQGGYFATSGQDASVLLRLKDDHDGAEPSGNSVAAINGIRLGTMLGREDWIQHAHHALLQFGPQLNGMPQALPKMLVALDLLHHPPRQLVLAGHAGKTDDLLAAVATCFHPHLVMLAANKELPEDLLTSPHLVAMVDSGRVAAHLCKDGACELPTQDPATLRAQIDPPTLG